MKNKTKITQTVSRRILTAILASFLLAIIPVKADPLDETYHQTFYITTIGGFNTAAGINNVFDYKSNMLAKVGGIMPKNIKVGYSRSFWPLNQTQGSYYDYLFNQAGADSLIDLAVVSDTPYGSHINGMPWGDSADQSLDILHNFLEKYDGGSYVQKDRNGNIRQAALEQTPYADEQSGSFSPFLEMQLTLSRNADLVQQYVGRNNRTAARLLKWYREQHPDLIVFGSMSSEYHQNVSANHEYCDYGDWSIQEFRDWLSGDGLYVGEAQYASLAAFNSAFGLSYSSWSEVAPPTALNWTTGSYWSKWHEFRIAQARNIEQAQIDWTYEAGISPDRNFGHQIPFTPGGSSQQKYACDWTTTFCDNGANGITTYGANSWSPTIFNAIYSNDKNWGIFEYNPLSSYSTCLSALNAVWNYKGHVLCPYNWYGQPTYQIYETEFGTALQQFISDHSGDKYSGLKSYESAPAGRDVIWAMSETDDIESSADIASIYFTNGIMSANVNGSTPEISLELDESKHVLKSEGYYSCSFRIYIENTEGVGSVAWHDSIGGENHSVTFIPKAGWNIYEINLAENSGWQEKNIDFVKFYPGAASGSEIKIDWLRFEANHCWNFDDPGEIFGVNNISGVEVTNSIFSGTDNSGDGYAYLSMDKDPADRAFIDTDIYKKIRVRMNCSENASCQIYWWARETGNTPYSHDVSVQPGMQTYEIDMSSVANWEGKIDRLRIDPVNISGVTFSVEYVSVSPEILPPRIANSDFIVNSPRPIFLWDAPIEPDYSGVTYSIELADDFYFTNTIYSVSGLTSETNIYNGSSLLDGFYWWRIRAEDSDGTISAWEYPMPIFVRPWTFDTTEDIWNANCFYPPAVLNGIWYAVTTNATPYDPFVNFTTGNDRGINAELYSRFLCRIKMSPAGVGNISQFFCFPKTTAHEAINFALPNDAKWHNIDLDLTSMTRWNGYIGGVRIDPGGGAGTTVEIDSAFLLPNGAELISIIDTNLLNGSVGILYSYTFSATNFSGQTTWELAAGTLPEGLILNANGVLNGTPTIAGQSVFEVAAKDKIWDTSKEFSIDVIPEAEMIFSLLSCLALLLLRRN